MPRRKGEAAFLGERDLCSSSGGGGEAYRREGKEHPYAAAVKYWRKNICSPRCSKKKRAQKDADLKIE